MQPVDVVQQHLQRKLLILLSTRLGCENKEAPKTVTPLCWLIDYVCVQKVVETYKNIAIGSA